MAPVSLGEIADKLSILDIKSRKISDPNAINNVVAEKIELEAVCKSHGVNFGVFLNQLIDINESLWDILQIQRDKEKNGELDEEFINVSLAVYHMNDKRFEVKKKINESLGSYLIEEKYYE